MYPIFPPAPPLKGKDFFMVSCLVLAVIAVINVGVLLLSDRDGASVFFVLTGLQLLVTIYAYFDMRKEKARKQ